MKKIILLFVFMVFSLTFTRAQHGYYKFDQRATYVSGFDGKKPLKKDTMVEVTEVFSNGIRTISEPYQAYKGETEKTFLKRIHTKDSLAISKKLSVMDSLIKEVYEEDRLAKKVKEKKALEGTENVLVGAAIVFLLMFIFALAEIVHRLMNRGKK